MQSGRDSSGLSLPQSAVLGLFGLLMVSTLLLSLPVSQVADKPLSMVDAFFTATSSLCSTGLSVVDTSTDFSPFGDTIIFLLFQIGGLGVLLWSTIVIVLLGGQLGLRHRLLMKEQLPGISMGGAGALAVRIFVYVFIVELIGAVFLWVRWYDRIPGIKGFAYAFYHSTSAFCNAGITLWSDDLAADVGDPVVNLTIMALATVGGLGYAVVRDVSRVLGGQKNRLSVHSRIVLWVTLILFVGGSVLFFIFEYFHQGVLADRPLTETILIPMFHCAVRTTGVSTVDFGILKPETLQLMMALMIVGGSPGSTAGGLKTTTVALVMLAAWAQIRGRDEVEVFGRRIHESQIFQALTITVIACGAVLGLVLIINFLETAPFSEILFETVSALTVVGFSTGITPELTDASKLLLCLAMFMGRVGPLTLALSLLQPRRRAAIRHPVEDVIIG